MATRVYRQNPGLHAEDVVEAAGAATTRLVEITVDCAVAGVGGTRVISRNEVIDAIEDIKQYVLSKNWPPV